MFDKMKKLMELQGKMRQIKKELEYATVEAESPCGRVKMTMSGEQAVKSVEIADELLNMANKDRLTQALLSCINQAVKKSQKLATEKVQTTAGLNLPGL
ncbi:MAG: YbaB/EbfC family nucleoid-associated protein [Candidatus Omnitrophota bacterium]